MAVAFPPILSARQSATPEEIDVLLANDRSSDGTSTCSEALESGKCLSADFLTAVSVLIIGTVFTPTLPYAFQQTGVFAGVLLCLCIPLVYAYSSMLWLSGWAIVETKYPERYKNKSIRRPYSMLAREAGGPVWEIIVRVSINVANFGITVTALLLATSTLQSLVPGEFSARVWLLICAGVVLPPMLLGRTTRSGRVAVAGAAFSGLSATVVLIALAYNRLTEPAWPLPVPPGVGNKSMPGDGVVVGSMAAVPSSGPDHISVTVTSLCLGASILFFSTCGMTIIPNIICDMKHKTTWKHITGFSHASVSIVGIATGTIGVETYGSRTHPIVLLNLQCNGSGITGNVLGVLASSLFAGVCLFMAVLNGTLVSANAEEALKLPVSDTTVKHLLARSVVLLVALGAAELMPAFDKYAALLGASAMAACAFIFPPLFYYWLCKASDKHIPLCRRTVMAGMVGFGMIGGLVCTYASVVNLLRHELPDPCHFR